jgi:hypothetical protein
MNVKDILNTKDLNLGLNKENNDRTIKQKNESPRVIGRVNVAVPRNKPERIPHFDRKPFSSLR